MTEYFCPVCAYEWSLAISRQATGQIIEISYV